MGIDCLVVIYKTAFFKSKLVNLKRLKIHDVMRFLKTTFFSSNNRHKYYLSMNFKFC